MERTPATGRQEYFSAGTACARLFIFFSTSESCCKNSARTPDGRSAAWADAAPRTRPAASTEEKTEGFISPLYRSGQEARNRSEEHTSELQSHLNLVCRLLLEKKKNSTTDISSQRHARRRA